VLPRLLEFLRPGGEVLAMVKPQFEVGKGKVGKGGVVRDPELQKEAVAKVAAAAAALGFQVSPAFPSPLKGPKGNQEYFLYLISPGKRLEVAEIIDNDSREP
jgi:23S rRNA (cytidine1920-2'-O)/16S rRNA (cytidine1409-2'-O)-methyltransferase